ncbi:hypothetical protein ACSR9G_01955 [Citrobacter koseri]|uniref:hypothetical protein n=1 Tax=Citrobacter koseri TaxID=545 RepID=UPI00403A09C3
MKSTVETKIIELVKLGHELAKELHCAESAALVSDLASQLEVQLARSNALAAKLSMINGLMDAAEQANKLAQEATKKLVQERDALAAENARLKQSKPSLKTMMSALDVFYVDEDVPESAMLAAYNILRGAVETPATYAFLAEVRASAIDNFVDIKTKQLADMHPDTHAFGATAMSIRSQINELQAFAANLRKGAAQ